MSDSGDRGRGPGGPGQEPRRPGGGNTGGRDDRNAGPAKGRPENGRPSSGRPTGDRPERSARDAERAQRNNDRLGRDSNRPARDGDRPQRSNDSPARDGDRPQRNHAERGGAGRKPEGEKRLWTSGGKPARGDRDARFSEPEEDRDPFNIRSVRPRHDDPEIPEGTNPKDLDRVAGNELKTLAKDNAEGVAQHLVMAARLIDTDPELAHRHALSAARRAGRIGVVRETLAITAYAIGDFALALRELRTYRRITGRDDQLPMMVDSERGIGRPDRALELGRSVPRSSLPVPVQVELAIAMSGARLDLEQPDLALIELQIPQLDPTTAFSYSPNLFAAFATVLEELGRDEEAEQWYAYADAAADALEFADNGGEEATMEIIEEDWTESELDEPVQTATEGDDSKSDD
ncbi:hypothetical protein HD599_000702 [Conyzicola lurida]|uniref:Primosomal protein n=1 Tax=Conyzicola lurida TaxID=1172621 RepID=A0A841ALS5_9MICO|nr:hypothetical protein [Conyzicola lurida]MBB5842379.1 hypothetical protein [Conyzicola lurida]